jgi:hypothetical protein
MAARGATMAWFERGMADYIIPVQGQSYIETIRASKLLFNDLYFRLFGRCRAG